MIRNQSNFAFDHKISGQIIGNPEFMNPFQSGPTVGKQQSKTRGKSVLNNQQPSFEPSSNKKSNKIKQAKQLLAQRLKEVTTLQFEEAQRNPNNTFANQIKENQKDKTKNWDYHMNPISKLTKQPFVRSKTCDQLRKQHSQKKQRKRNNSATKYTSPHTNQCEREVRSTGLHSKQVQSEWIQHQQYNQSKGRSGKVETKQFVVDPFANNMIETFDEEQIKKLSSEVTRKKYKGKYASVKKEPVQMKQEPTVSSEIKYPFRINSVYHQESKSPIKFENSRNSSSSNLLINEFNYLEPSKFTPKLERYAAFQTKQSQVLSPPQNQNFQKIQIRKNQQQILRNQPDQGQYEPQHRQESVENSDDERSQQQAYYSPDNSEEIRMRSGARFSYNQNELVTNLHFTNAILQQKLRIKEIQIQEMNRNYFKMKTELLHAKNIQNQNIRYPQSHNLKILTTSLSNEKYLTNLETQGKQQIFNSQFVNQSNEISSLPSPKFCDGVEEEFSRQRYIASQIMQQIPISHQRQQNFAYPIKLHSKFAKKKQLFSSDMSEKISEEFDSQEIYMPSHYEPEHSHVSRKYVFKKSHFNENNSARFEQENPKRDSYIYTLGEESQMRSSSKNNISEGSSQRKISGNGISQEMLLQPITQTISSQSEKIDLLSPIKSNSTQKVENDSFRHSFRTSLTKSDNRMQEDSLRRFDYYLTPQKDQNTFIRHEDKAENEGLFEKAFSSLRKKRDSLSSSGQKVNPLDTSSQHTENYRYSSSSSKKQQIIDPIIEHAIQ